MDKVTKSSLWISENILKDEVYESIEKQRMKAESSVNSNKAYVESGSFEEQDSFMAHNPLSSSQKKWNKVESLVGNLYSKPYFSHISTISNGDREEFFLSDNENLENVQFIGENGYLLPFKKDSDRPLFSKIFHCRQLGNGETFTKNDGAIVKPTLICDDDILNAELLDTNLIYSEDKDREILIDSDELLVEKLQANRGNPALSNIISTLQHNQFEIIKSEESSDFVVQGCAGSGKSQILIHRLFFLRDMLSESNWEKVLLITPSALFRNYSSKLMRRYGLSSIKNMSIAELYKRFLDAFDSNFQNRQYHFEFTEEYLPDEYLHEIYTDSCIREIDIEINKAIQSYIEDACKLLELVVPEEFDDEYVKELSNKLKERIDQLDRDMSEDGLILNVEQIEDERRKYKDQRERIEDSIKHLQDEYEEKLKQKREFDDSLAELKNIKKERSEWLVQREMKISNIKRDLTDYEMIEPSKLPYDIPGKYAALLFLLDDFTKGETFQNDEVYLELLNQRYKQASDNVSDICQDQKPEQFGRWLQGRILFLIDEIQKRKNKLSELNTEFKLFEQKQLSRQMSKNELKSLRSSYVSSRFFLQRLETTVFEKQVWNKLAPIKEKYGIKTMVEGRGKKRIRILYKSDLLFYLKIYARLHSYTKLPDYKFICIDEGQDLHAIDYAILRKLYPKAVFNVFGDTAQVLHLDCGIHNWDKDTFVKQVYRLNKNYRNTAAIVEFCNKKFGSEMEYLGNPERDKYPEVIRYVWKLSGVLKHQDVTVIVKNRSMFDQFCSDLELPQTEFQFIDTNSVSAESSKYKCYTIYAAKGLEFSNVLVYSSEMTKNQKVVACTRAMENLYYYE